MTTAKSVSNGDRITGERVRALRLAKSLSASDLAARIGVAHQQISMYETGRYRISPRRLQAIAQALGAPVSALFEERPAVDLGGLSRMLVTPDAHDLLRAYTAITDDGLRSDIVVLVGQIARMHRRRLTTEGPQRG